MSAVLRNNSGKFYLFGSFGVEGLSDNKRTIDTKCVRASAEALQFWRHRLLELHNETEKDEKIKLNTEVITRIFQTLYVIFREIQLFWIGHSHWFTNILWLCIKQVKYGSSICCANTVHYVKVRITQRSKGRLVNLVLCLTFDCVFVSHEKRGLSNRFQRLPGEGGSRQKERNDHTTNHQDNSLTNSHSQTRGKKKKNNPYESNLPVSTSCKLYNTQS